MFGISAGAAAAVGAIGAAAIGGIASNSAAKKQAAATGDAAAAQLAATEETIAENARQYDLTRSDFEPWREAGKTALGQYQTEINGNTSAADALAEPGYQFGLQQGQQALDRKAAASGGRVSGAALKAATEYGTNYATTGYNAAYQRRQDRLNRLAALANVGQTATGASAAAGAGAAASDAAARSGSANAISNLIARQGDASGAATLAQANIWGNAGNKLASLYSPTVNPSTSWAGSNYSGTPYNADTTVPMQAGGGY